MYARIPASTRNRVAALIAAGNGRNEIAREVGVSTGFVSKVAREHGLHFERAAQVATAVRAQQIDQWAARERVKNAILDELFALTPNRRRREARLRGTAASGR